MIPTVRAVLCVASHSVRSAHSLNTRFTPLLRCHRRAFTPTTTFRSTSALSDQSEKLPDNENVEEDEVEELETNRWSAVLDPDNPPKLSVEHYALLSRLAARQPTTSDTSTSLDPELDAAIANISRMLDTLTDANPDIREDIEELASTVETEYRQEAAKLSPSAPAAKLSPSAPTVSRPQTFKLPCRFCAIKKRKTDYPDMLLTYTNLSLLHRFINLRGMIYPRRVTGNCQRHQRELSTAVKRARFLGLLSYTSNWSVDGLNSEESAIDAIPDVTDSVKYQLQELTALDDLESDDLSDADHRDGTGSDAGINMAKIDFHAAGELNRSNNNTTSSSH